MVCFPKDRVKGMKFGENERRKEERAIEPEGARTHLSYKVSLCTEVATSYASGTVSHHGDTQADLKPMELVISRYLSASQPFYSEQ